jgi:hypothetical protein
VHLLCDDKVATDSAEVVSVLLLVQLVRLYTPVQTPQPIASSRDSGRIALLHPQLRDACEARGIDLEFFP